MKHLERAFSWLLVAPAILPVVIWGGLIYPYLVPKTLLFYTFGLVTVAVFAVLVAHGKWFFWSRLARKETWIPGALLALAYVASYVGMDFYRSFWSLFVRGDGLLTLTLVVAYFYMIILSADRAFFTRLVRVVAGIAGAVAVYGIGEWLLGGGRIGSLLGNAAFFAGYLGIGVFATVMAGHTLSREWHRAAYVLAALEVVAIILSATRGTMLALGVAFVAWLAYLAWQGKREVRTRAAIALGALVILGGGFFAFRSTLAQVSFEPIARIASISTQETDVASRLFIWKNMMSEIAQAPILGVGAEHINTLFDRFYDPTQIVEQWFDRSHNAFIDYAVQYGVGGVILYALLIATFFLAARRIYVRDRTLALLVALLAITYATQNFFVFDTISSFWLIVALLAALLAVASEGDAREELALPGWMRPASWGVAAILIYCVFPVAVRPAMAAYDLAHAYIYTLVDVPQEVQYLKDGFALDTYGNLEYGYEVYDMYSSQQTLTGQARVEAYNEALAILTANFNRYTYDARTALYLAHVLSLAPEGVTVDNNLLSEALARAIKFSPKRAQPWYILVNLSIAQANTYPIGSVDRAKGYAAARDILTKYTELVPKLSEPHFVLAQLEYASGDRAAAAEEAEKGKTTYKGDLKTARRAAMYYEIVRDLPNAAFFLSEVVRMDPSDTAAAGDLAKIQAYEQSRK